MNIFNYISEKEKAAYFEFKKRFNNEVFPADIKEDEWMYIRFLRARELNLDSAEKMLRNHLAWRKSFQVDTKSFKEFVSDEEMVKYLPFSRMGPDSEGCSIHYFDFGKMDLQGVLKTYKKNDLVKAVIKHLENDVALMQERTKKLGKPIQQLLLIANFEDATFGKVTNKQNLDLFWTLLQIYEANYPERLKEALMINTSRYFALIFAFLKPLLTAATLKKVTVFGKDGWKEHIQSIADKDAVPQFLGGNRTDPDGNPLCHTIVRHGLNVPESLYRKKESISLKEQPGVSTIIISRMSKVHMKAVVLEKDSVLEWVFETESRNIGFAVFYKPTDDADCPGLEVVPKEKIDSHLISEEGMFKCEDPGLYILVFDNSYSWIFTKEVHYKIDIVYPDGQRFPVTH